MRSVLAFALLAALTGCWSEGEPTLIVHWDQACRLAGSGRLQCWGQTIGEAGSSRDPGYVWPALELPAPLVHAAVGQDYACVVHDAGEIVCWGSDGPTSNTGRLGYRKTQTSSEHVTTAVDDPFVRVAAYQHTCGVTAAGDVWCWGPNYRGSLGLGHREPIGDDEMPAVAGRVELGVAVEDIVVGQDHTCALVVDGSVRCWGDVHNLGVPHDCPHNGSCEDLPGCCIGDDETASAAPTVPLPAAAVRLATGGAGTCAVLVDGTVQCWYTQPEPLDLGEPATAITLSPWHTCVVLKRGALRCWGNNYHGELGLARADATIEDIAPKDLPDVDVGGRVVAAGAGAGFTCAMLDDGAVRCWGGGPSTITGRDRDTSGCTVTEPNPNADAICEPAFIEVFHCSTASHCYLGDDEHPSTIPTVPLD